MTAPSKAAHTPGPWILAPENDETVITAAGNFYWISWCHLPHQHESYGINPKADARLIAAAPAMDLALRLIACGAARIERSPSGSLEEFCFGGLRYCMNGDWNSLFDVIGWGKARAAIAKATGAQP